MLADGSGDYIPVATTRPETILGVLLWRSILRMKDTRITW
jgi:type IV secretory pathway VirB3-like protein